jgi:hypothetical protein
MRTFSQKATRLFVRSSLVFGWAGAMYACTVEDENPAVPRRDAGANSETGSSTTNPDAPTGAPLCGKYGGYAQVQAMATGILDRARGDCRIGAPFAAMGPEASQHLTECFQKQLGGAFQCPGVTYVANTTADSVNRKCRDMSTAHQELGLRNADFNAFLEAVTTELTARGLSQDDLRAIAPVFEGTRTGVVREATQPDKNTHCACVDGLFEGVPCVVDSGVQDSGSDAEDASDDG